MEIAVSTLYTLDRTIDETMSLIPGIPSRFIELVDAGRHALNPSKVEALLEIKEAHGLEYSVHAPYTDANIASDDPTIREAILNRMEASIGYASDLGAKTVVFHPGNTTALEWALPTETAWRINLESTRRLVEHAEGLGVRAMIENVPEPFPFLMKSVEHFRRFYDEIGVEAYMVLDVAHAHIRGEELDFIREFGGRIGHIHVSDNHGDKDTHLKIGDGSVAWGEVMKALRESPFDGWVTIESHEKIPECVRLLENLK